MSKVLNEDRSPPSPDEAYQMTQQNDSKLTYDYASLKGYD